MKSRDSQQIEFDVFPKNAKDNYSYLADIKKDTPSGSPSFTVALPHQSVIILLLCMVMLLVASFTLGVERGKLVSKNKASAPPAPWEKIATPALEAGTPPQEAAAGTARQDEPPAATAAKKKDEPGPGNYVIQVASLKTEQAASRLAEMLTKEGWPSFTKTSGDYVVVLAGTFLKKEEAQGRIGELRKTYSDCFIKKI